MLVERTGSHRLLVGALLAVAALRLLTIGLYTLADTTEARYAEVARKMVELNNWITPWYDYGVPFWAKPPLSTWLTAGSFMVLGVNEFAARLPHFLMACLVAWLVWDWLRQRSMREAFLAVIMLAASLLFFVSAGAVMTDMALALGTTMALRGFWLGMWGAPAQRTLESTLAFVGLGVGLLAKGAGGASVDPAPAGRLGTSDAQRRPSVAAPPLVPRQPTDRRTRAALVCVGRPSHARLSAIFPCGRALAALRHARLGR
jgi:4-amino-4-deoxy-L-arabinose transferase-like glycosyltransferase